MVIFKIYGHLCSKGLSLNITRDCRNYVFLHAECLTWCPTIRNWRQWR